MPKPEPGSLVPFAPDHYESELALAKSGVAHTILRNSWYVENLFMALPQMLASGKWYSSAGEGRIAHVARADAAEAAAAALRAAPGGRFDITGPTLRTTKEIAAVIAEVFAKPVEVVAVSDEQLAAGLAGAGLPPALVELIVAFDGNTRAGGLDVRTDAVQKLTGKPPRGMREVLTASKGAFAS
jgi:NAD(P)H dehydrogenase (quinone)